MLLWSPLLTGQLFLHYFIFIFNALVSAPRMLQVRTLFVKSTTDVVPCFGSSLRVWHANMLASPSPAA